MSLIPSESYSFPDHFTSTVTPSRRQKQEKLEAKKVLKKPAIVALPDPEPEPEQVLAAEPAFQPEFEPTAEPEFVPEIWEPEMPEAQAPTFKEKLEAKLTAWRERRNPPPPVGRPEMLTEIWEPGVPELPEMPQIKAAPRPPARPAPPIPNPAVRRAHAPPPRIPEPPVRKIALPPTLKPKVRWNNRAPAMDPSTNGNNNNNNGNGAAKVPTLPLPAQNVIPMRPARPAPMPKPAPRPPQPAAPPRPAAPQAPRQAQLPRKPVPGPAQIRPAQPRPAPAPPKRVPQMVSNPQADFFEMFAENGYELANKRRREMKFRRFLAWEGAALLVLLPLVILGLTLNINAPALRWIMNILTIAAAMAAVVIPIVFYAANPTLPEIER